MDTINQLTWYPSYAKAIQSLPYILRGEEVPEELVPYPPSGKERLEAAGETLGQLRDPEQAAAAFMPGGFLRTQAKPIAQGMLKQAWEAFRRGEIAPHEVQAVGERLQKTFSNLGQVLKSDILEHRVFQPGAHEGTSWSGAFQKDLTRTGQYKYNIPEIEIGVPTVDISSPERLFGTVLHEASHHLTYGWKSPADTMKWVKPLTDDLWTQYTKRELNDRVYNMIDSTYGPSISHQSKLDYAKWASRPEELIANHLELLALERAGLQPTKVQKLFGSMLPEELANSHFDILYDLTSVLVGK